MASCMRADHRDYAEADVASAAACTMGAALLVSASWQFQVDDQLVFGRLPDRALGVTMLRLSKTFKGGGVDMPDRGSYSGLARTVHSAQCGRAKPFVPPDGVDEP